MNVEKRSHVGINYMMDDDKLSVEEDISTSHTRLRERRTSWFGLLLDNLDTLEKSFADSDALKLERDILLQLGRLGALEYFNACLSRTLQTSNVSDLSAVPSENIRETKTDGTLDNHIGKVARTKSVQNNLQKPTFVRKKKKKKTSSSRSRRLTIARNEGKMSKGVKVYVTIARNEGKMSKGVKVYGNSHGRFTSGS